MTPGTFNFKPQYKGNTFNGVQLSFSSDDAPINLSKAFIQMQLKTSLNASSSKDFSNGNGITVTDAEGGVINIDKFLVDLAPARYLYDLKITFQDGTVRTYLTGTFDVKQNLV
jgi:hypothetical protein